ncbi:hypothetical protein BST81_16905 [Leptolyngbya sp. 'hensonii']|uniref:hypothetical protein n=1 Tax=Leptolyngbya sp. 'hensonii' TaxID=1922337 RepID=UPI0009501B6A|nr:hypothetical protein [Leptolyngbya sp. 'hensonii']OLP17044.1 hypothetical protein BST81_16905 [Leptolyngbya sp. 'hensonii']
MNLFLVVQLGSLHRKTALPWNQNPCNSRTFDYRHYQNGSDFFFDAVDEDQAYITIQESYLKQGDFLILKVDDQLVYYRIEQIDYYSELPDLWIALIRKGAK